MPVVLWSLNSDREPPGAVGLGTVEVWSMSICLKGEMLRVGLLSTTTDNRLENVPGMCVRDTNARRTGLYCIWPMGEKLREALV